MAWTDEQRTEAVEAYEAAEPTAETSMEIVKEIAEDMEQSVNGVRMILTKAGVYIKKADAKAVGAASGGKGGGRVSKQASQDALTAVITDAGQEADDDVISKLTGKAAVYFTKVLNGIAGVTDPAEDE